MQFIFVCRFACGFSFNTRIYHSYSDVTMTVKDCKESGLRTAKLAVLLIKIMKYGIVLFYYINN